MYLICDNNSRLLKQYKIIKLTVKFPIILSFLLLTIPLIFCFFFIKIKIYKSFKKIIYILNEWYGLSVKNNFIDYIPVRLYNLYKYFFLCLGFFFLKIFFLPWICQFFSMNVTFWVVRQCFKIQMFSFYLNIWHDIFSSIYFPMPNFSSNRILLEFAGINTNDFATSTLRQIPSSFIYYKNTQNENLLKNLISSTDFLIKDTGYITYYYDFFTNWGLDESFSEFNLPSFFDILLSKLYDKNIYNFLPPVFDSIKNDELLQQNFFNYYKTNKNNITFVNLLKWFWLIFLYTINLIFYETTKTDFDFLFSFNLFCLLFIIFTKYCIILIYYKFLIKFFFWFFVNLFVNWVFFDSNGQFLFLKQITEEQKNYWYSPEIFILNWLSNKWTKKNFFFKKSLLQCSQMFFLICLFFFFLIFFFRIFFFYPNTILPLMTIFVIFQTYMIFYQLINTEKKIFITKTYPQIIFFYKYKYILEFYYIFFRFILNNFFWILFFISYIDNLTPFIKAYLLLFFQEKEIFHERINIINANHSINFWKFFVNYSFFFDYSWKVFLGNDYLHFMNPFTNNLLYVYSLHPSERHYLIGQFLTYGGEFSSSSHAHHLQLIHQINSISIGEEFRVIDSFLFNKNKFLFATPGVNFRDFILTENVFRNQIIVCFFFIVLFFLVKFFKIKSIIKNKTRKFVFFLQKNFYIFLFLKFQQPFYFCLWTLINIPFFFLKYFVIFYFYFFIAFLVCLTKFSYGLFYTEKKYDKLSCNYSYANLFHSFLSDFYFYIYEKKIIFFWKNFFLNNFCKKPRYAISLVWYLIICIMFFIKWIIKFFFFVESLFLEKSYEKSFFLRTFINFFLTPICFLFNLIFLLFFIIFCWFLFEFLCFHFNFISCCSIFVFSSFLDLILQIKNFLKFLFFFKFFFSGNLKLFFFKSFIFIPFFSIFTKCFLYFVFILLSYFFLLRIYIHFFKFISFFNKINLNVVKMFKSFFLCFHTNPNKNYKNKHFSIYSPEFKKFIFINNKLKKKYFFFNFRTHCFRKKKNVFKNCCFIFKYKLYFFKYKKIFFFFKLNNSDYIQKKFFFSSINNYSNQHKLFIYKSFNFFFKKKNFDHLFTKKNNYSEIRCLILINKWYFFFKILVFYIKLVFIFFFLLFLWESKIFIYYPYFELSIIETVNPLVLLWSIISCIIEPVTDAIAYFFFFLYDSCLSPIIKYFFKLFHIFWEAYLGDLIGFLIYFIHFITVELLLNLLILIIYVIYFIICLIYVDIIWFKNVYIPFFLFIITELFQLFWFFYIKLLIYLFYFLSFIF